MALLLLWGSSAVLFGAILCALHRRVPVWGYGPLFLAVGGLVVSIFHTAPVFFEIDLPGGWNPTRFHLASVFLFPFLLALILLLYNVDGTARARILLGGILLVNLFYGVCAVFLEDFSLRSVAAGCAALAIDAGIAIVLFQFMTNRCPRCPQPLRFFLVLGATLTVDSFLFRAFSGGAIAVDRGLVSEILGKGFTSVFLSLPFGGYLQTSSFPVLRRPTLDLLLPPYDVLGRRVLEAERDAEGLRSEFEIFYRMAADLGKDSDLEETLRRVVREGSRILRADLVWVFLYDERSQSLVARAGPRDREAESIVLSSEPPSLAFSAFEEQKVLISENPSKDPRAREDLLRRHGDRTFLAVPLVTSGISFGTLLFSRTRAGNPFTSKDASVGRALAGHAASAIANARLLEESIELNQRLAAREKELSRHAELERIAAQTATQLLSRQPEEIEAAIREALRELGKWAAVDRARVLLYDPNGEKVAATIEWRAQGLLPHDPDVVGLRSADFPWLHERILRNEIIRADDPEKIPQDASDLRALLAAMGVHSFVCVPLWHEDRPIGLLSLSSHRPVAIQEKIEDTLRVFAGIFVNGVQRRDRALRAAAQTDLLRKRNRILIEAASHEALAEGDLDAALRAITRLASEALKVERTSVWFYSDSRDGIRCARLYQRTENRDADGTFLRAKDFPLYFRALEEERTIAADDARGDPRTREFAEPYLAPLGIASMLDAPIRFRGKMCGVLCSEHVGEKRSWTPEETDFAGDIATLVALAMEASERRKAEGAIRATASVLRSTLDSTADGILVIDREGRIVTYNHRFAEMWGVPPEILAQGRDDEAIRFVLSQLKDPEGFTRRIADLYAAPEEDSFDTLLFLDGRIVERFSVPQRLEGVPVGRVWSFRDVTKREQAERRLQRAHADLSTFHSLVTHDLSNFSMTLLGLVDRLLSDSDDPLSPKQTELLRRADRQAREMSRLAENAKILSRLRDEKIPEPGAAVPLGPVLHEALETVRSLHFDRPFRVELDLSDDLTVRNTPFLSNLLLNLLDNAVRHSERGPTPLIEIHAAPETAGIRVTILGGSPPDGGAMVRLFDRYAPGRRSRGSGLGLALVRDVVRRLGGEVEARVGSMGGKPAFVVELRLP